MSDEIKGTAVLDDRNSVLRLFCCCVPSPGSGREVELAVIPLRPRGTPRGHENEWEYDVAGDVIHVTPSVRLSAGGRELFHNGGDWRVNFVRWSEVKGKLPDDHPWDYWRRVNDAYFPKNATPPGP